MSTKALRRLRKTPALRNSLAETLLTPSDFILPYFVIEGKGKKDPIPSMPGIFRFTLDTLLKDLETIQTSGITSVLLFGIPSKKDSAATQAYATAGIVQKAVRSIKKVFPALVVYTDVCVCGFTTHGHCGFLKGKGLDHAASCKVLSKIAVSHAEAGADFVAPSAMMDGQVQAIRDALDQRGFDEVGILSYAAKFASNFYGPFREALDSSPQFGDRRSYQMDFRNAEEALREIAQDIDQGADIVMVKPALAYLDIIARAKERFRFPLAAYNVSGEYSLIKTAAKGQEKRERALALESLYAMKRAGADLIISYFAKDIPKWLNETSPY